MKTQILEILLTSGEAAAVLEKSRDSVHHYEKNGVLPAAFKTKRGLRLFRREDVEKLKADREKRKARAK